MPKKGGNCSKNELIRSAQAACACGWLKAAVFRGAQKKCAKTLQVVAIKAVAHKLARACFHVMKTGTPFDAARAFG